MNEFFCVVIYKKIKAQIKFTLKVEFERVAVKGGQCGAMLLELVEITLQKAFLRMHVSTNKEHS